MLEDPGSRCACWARRPGQLRRARGAGSGGQRVRRLPRPAHQPRRAVARRPGVGSIEPIALPPGRQPRTGPVHARRRRRLRRRGASRPQQRRHHRRPERRRGGAVGSSEPRWATPREVRARQPHLQMDRLPTMPGDPRVRVTTSADLRATRPADDYTEEVGVCPRTTRAAATSTGRGSGSLIGRGWSMAAFHDEGGLQGRGRCCATRHAARCRASGCDPTAAARASRWRGWRRCVPRPGDRHAPVVSLTSTSGQRAGASDETPGSGSSRPDLRHHDVLTPRGVGEKILPDSMQSHGGAVHLRRR